MYNPIKQLIDKIILLNKQDKLSLDEAIILTDLCTETLDRIETLEEELNKTSEELVFWQRSLQEYSTNE